MAAKPMTFLPFINKSCSYPFENIVSFSNKEEIGRKLPKFGRDLISRFFQYPLSSQGNRLRTDFYQFLRGIDIKYALVFFLSS